MIIESKSGSLLFSSEGVVTIVGGESLVSNGKDATISAASYIGGSGGASRLDS